MKQITPYFPLSFHIATKLNKLFSRLHNIRFQTLNTFFAPPLLISSIDN